jgi:hypothetical protein
LSLAKSRFAGIAEAPASSANPLSAATSQPRPNALQTYVSVSNQRAKNCFEGWGLNSISFYFKKIVTNLIFLRKL